MCDSEYEWIKKNAEIAINEGKKGRAVLIINSAINDAQKIYRRIIENGYSEKNIKICTG